MMERIEVTRLARGYVHSDHVVNIVYAAGVCRRTVEVTWDDDKGELVFTVKRPAPKRVIAAAKRRA